MPYINWNAISGCTAEERGSMLPYIDRLLALKLQVEQKGVCGFEDFLRSTADPFERTAVRLITEGYMPDVCRAVLFRLLNASELACGQYLKGVIFAEFLLAIQEKPIGLQELKLRLLSWLGLDYVDRLFP